MRSKAHFDLWKAMGKRQIRKMLKKNGYSNKAIKAILKWYE
jgi:hypothetical protein